VSLRVLVLHGPNLNLLGERDPDVYGTMTLDELNAAIAATAAERGLEPTILQSNDEGALVDLIQDARRWAGAIVINPGGYSHTSVAIRDAIAAAAMPAIEVHLSNPSAREWFRHTDLVAGACRGVIAGFGWRSYIMALEAVAGLASDQQEEPAP
jgi:3-dehydroquinate dehydratase-2